VRCHTIGWVGGFYSLIAMIPFMVSVGLFDMSLWLFVGVFCTSKAHCFDDSSSLLPFGVDVRRVVSFCSPTLVLNCLQPPTFVWSALSFQRPSLTTETLREPTFFVVLFGPHAAKRVGFKPTVFRSLVESLRP